MADLVRWDPFSELQNVRDEMNKIFADTFSRFPVLGPVEETIWSPAVDVYQTTDEVIVEAELPGVKQEDLSISVTKDTLRIAGEVKEAEAKDGVSYLRRERRKGRFVRNLGLPVEVNSDAVKATYKDGILQIVLPKAEEVKPKTVQINVV